MTIDDSMFYNIQSAPKTEEIVNNIIVNTTLPILDSGTSTIYDTDEEFTIPTGETEVVVTLNWDNLPVDTTTVIVSKVDVIGTNTISSSNIYVWGGVITVTGTAGNTFTLSATGKASTTSDTQYVTEDSDSAEKYGKKTFTLSNHLVQSFDLAKEIGDTILTTYKNLRKDIKIKWPGDTIVEIGDEVEVEEFKNESVTTTDDFYIIKQKLSFNGALDVETELRRKL